MVVAEVTKSSKQKCSVEGSECSVHVHNNQVSHVKIPITDQSEVHSGFKWRRAQTAETKTQLNISESQISVFHSNWNCCFVNLKLELFRKTTAYQLPAERDLTSPSLLNSDVISAPPIFHSTCLLDENFKFTNTCGSTTQILNTVC